MMIFTPLRRPFLLLVTLLIAGPAIGCGGEPPAEEEEHSVAPVQAEPAKKIAMGEWTDLFGTTQPLPNHSARVSAAVEGHVLSVLGNGKGPAVVEGQHVKEGQVIVQLDDRVPRANRAKLQATLHDLDEQHKQANYAVQLAALDVERLRDLLKTTASSGSLPLVSRVELEKAQLLHKDAQSKLRAVAAKQVAANADLKALDEQLAFYSLRAPIAGRLSIVQAVPGQTLTPGTIVADVVNLDQIDVLCYAPPDSAGRLKLNQSAKLVLEEGGDEDAAKRPRGKVVFIDAQAQAETGNVLVKVRFPNPGHLLRTHAVVRVYVLTQPERPRFTIPEAALFEDEEHTSVLVVEDLKTKGEGKEAQQVGKVRKLNATLGIRDREQHVVELLGVQDSEKKGKIELDNLLFVTSGGNGLQNDDEVRLEKEEHEKEEHK